ncbi:hypothetical protein Glove_341g4 [Diversispora epigaea]|uniref:Uncharacterized protein n=1 Tax=Diversispora epigaea TaxID=1348612 RepID=A0A397HGG9_9GLOM|nr:hypothetical protein Glove_341g4 [Diversispora epigaea]
MFFGFKKDAVKIPRFKEKDTTNNSLSTRRQVSSLSSPNGSIRVAMSRLESPAHSVNGDSSKPKPLFVEPDYDIDL